MYYPIVLKIDRQPIVIVGGGEVAEGKVEALLECGAVVTVVSPKLTEKLRSLVEAGDILWQRRPYERGDVKNAFFVIAATGDPQVQQQIFLDARGAGVLINCVDEPERCDFIMPSVVRRDDLIVAVSTSGRSPAFAAWLRRKLESWLTADFGRVVRVLGAVRDDVRQRFDTVRERKNAYDQIIDSGIVNWIAECDDATAEARVHEMLQEL
jgi:precorrin-2 dehydrogenase/sirohydrochlorin ferrochelatase